MGVLLLVPLCVEQRHVLGCVHGPGCWHRVCLGRSDARQPESVHRAGPSAILVQGVKDASFVHAPWSRRSVSRLYAEVPSPLPANPSPAPRSGEPSPSAIVRGSRRRSGRARCSVPTHPHGRSPPQPPSLKAATGASSAMRGIGLSGLCPQRRLCEAGSGGTLPPYPLPSLPRVDEETPPTDLGDPLLDRWVNAGYYYP